MPAMYKVIGGDQKEYGPVTDEELRRWLAEGRLSGQSLAKVEGTADWKPLASFSEFEPELRAQASRLSTTSPAPQRFDTEAWRAQVQARQPVLNVGSCLSRSWGLLKANFGLFLAASALFWLVGLVEFIPLMGLAYLLLRGVLLGGLYLVFLKRIRGQAASPTEVFAGFSLAFAQLMLVGLVSTLLSTIGFVCCLLPGIYLFVAWIFGVPLVADKRLEFWSAMELSRVVVTRVWFKVLALLLVAYLPVVLVTLFVDVKIFSVVFPFIKDLIASGAHDPGRLSHSMSEWIAQVSRLSFSLGVLIRVVLLANLPFALGALMYAYEDLFGARETRAA